MGTNRVDWEQRCSLVVHWRFPGIGHKPIFVPKPPDMGTKSRIFRGSRIDEMREAIGTDAILARAGVTAPAAAALERPLQRADAERMR